MATKVINTGDSSSGLLAVVVIVLALAIGFVLYSQGFFGKEEADININLPGGKTVSGSVSE